jgi:malonate-semialdehyde dehydrogenase (acetylating)/methylmalonate-semialdehyde dehydrogenase
MSTAGELDEAVTRAAEAQLEWGSTPVKDRVQVLFRMKALMEAQVDRLAETIIEENGKTREEALGSILRAIECLEFASSLPQMATGGALEVSPGVECRTTQYPLGVVAGITPFNFPLMVPLWMIPIALACGNAFVLKPSEQTPLSALELARLLDEAGLPPGVFSIVNGDREVGEAICDHPDIKAIGFVGSTTVAQAVYRRGTSNLKRVRANASGPWAGPKTTWWWCRMPTLR